MGEEAQNYIDSKFQTVISTLKWFGGILITILIIFASAIGANTWRSLSNKKDLQRYNSAIHEMVTKKQMERLIEFSKLRKELILTALADGGKDDINLLWLRLEELEQDILRDDYGTYFRGATAKDSRYKDALKDRYNSE